MFSKKVLKNLTYEKKDVILKIRILFLFMCKMKKLLGVFVVCASLAVSLLGIQSLHAQQTTDVNLVITWGTLTIWATGSFNFDAITLPTVQTVQEKQFTWDLDDAPFWVQDYKWLNSGYYTTVSISDLTWQNTASVILATNIKIKVDAVEAVLVTGTANSDVVLNTGSYLLSYQNFDSPITFINRPEWANAGKIGKYGARPYLQITVPAYQAADTYQGIITYTLFDQSL